MGDRTRKLVALRTRTDNDLLILVQRELNTGFAMLEGAATRNSPLFARAEQALATAKTLLPRITYVSQDDRLRIEAEVEELRFRLALVPSYARSYPASVAS